MAKKKVFVSYDHSEDLLHKNLLLAWHANPNFDFEFDQRSPNVPINSDDAATVKRALAAKLGEADYLLVLVGAKSADSSWMKWEIDRAKQSDIKLKLAAVKLASSNTLPVGLTIYNTAIASEFKQDLVIAALDKATNNY